MCTGCTLAIGERVEASAEHELRGTVAALAVTYVGGSVESLDTASVDDFRQLIRAAYIVVDEGGPLVASVG